ncbi:hypothetical protein TU81_25510 [Pseudomonas lini]|nr:hypothetical protein TU81_25510 [Pseudomonas lini]
MRERVAGATIGLSEKDRLVHKKSGKMDGWQCYIAGIWPNASQLSAIHVGAGLLAKAVYQATAMLDVSPSSRASPLPQVPCLNGH